MTQLGFFSKVFPSGILVLAFSLSAIPMAYSATPGTDKTVTKTVAKPLAVSEQPKKKANTAKDTIPTGPVLNDTTQKQLNEMGRSIDPDTKESINAAAKRIKEEDQLIKNEVRDNEADSFSSIGMLWSAAVEHNQTIRFTIEQLSRRDATGKPVANDGMSKRILQSLVNLGGVAGTVWTGTPASLIGSNMIQNAMAGNPQDAALSRVTDADMASLAKKVDTLQTRLITLYFNYLNAKEKLKLTQEANAVVEQSYKHAMQKADSTNQKALQPLMNSMLESAEQNEELAKQSLQSAESELSILVGPEAVAALNKKNEEESTAKTSEKK